MLDWWPNFAGVARSGDLGFTTGPATINGGKPGIFYFTVWARQPDGGWKWVFDGGVDADGAAAPGPERHPARPAARRRQADGARSRHGPGARRRDRARRPRQDRHRRGLQGRAGQGRPRAGLARRAGGEPDRRGSGAGHPAQDHRLWPARRRRVARPATSSGPMATRAGPAAAATMSASGSAAPASGRWCSIRSSRSRSQSAPLAARFPDRLLQRLGELAAFARAERLGDRHLACRRAPGAGRPCGPPPSPPRRG